MEQKRYSHEHIGYSLPICPIGTDFTINLKQRACKSYKLHIISKHNQEICQKKYIPNKIP